MLVFSSCVDDYEDANPPRLLDAPAVTSDQSGSTIDVVGGETISLTLNIVDAQAGIGGITVTSAEDDPEFTSNINSLIGATEGTLVVDYVVPFTAQGAFTVSVGVSDVQVDAEGDDANKTTTVDFSLNASFAFAAPIFTLTTDATDLDADGVLLAGDVMDFTLTLTDVPSGSLALAVLSASGGSLDYNQADLDALIGSSSGSLSGTFTAGEASATGSISVFLVDELQARSVSGSSADILVRCPSDDDISNLYAAISHGVSRDGVEYNFITTEVLIERIDAGTFSLSDPSFGEYPIVRGVAPSTATRFLSICGSEIVPVAGEFFQHSGTVSEDEEGNIVMDIEWVNASGDQGITRLTVAPCTAPDYSGDYTTLASGTYGSGGVNNYTDLAASVTLTSIGCLDYEIDDMSFGLYAAAYGDDAPAGVITIDGTVITGSPSNVDQYSDPFTINGTVNMDGTFTITWSNTYGDSGTVTVTP